VVRPNETKAPSTAPKIQDKNALPSKNAPQVDPKAPKLDAANKPATDLKKAPGVNPAAA
jgi:hypothetical protein